MISNADIQAGWISRLKANTAITARISATEIREDGWQGTDFRYPNIRVQLHTLVPQVANSECKIFSSSVSILVFGEQKSSKTVDEIAGIVAHELWGHTFSSNGVRYASVSLTGIDPATIQEGDGNTWKASVNLTALVQSV